MSDDKRNTYTIILDDNEIVEKTVAYSLIGGFLLNPLSADAQAVHPIAFGRASVGDHCSMIVASIQTAKKLMEEQKVPADLQYAILRTAIQEGMNFF